MSPAQLVGRGFGTVEHIVRFAPLFKLGGGGVYMLEVEKKYITFVLLINNYLSPGLSSLIITGYDAGVHVSSHWS